MRKLHLVILAILLGALLGLSIRICRRPPPEKKEVKKPEISVPRVAIVLDDWGYNEEIFSEAKQTGYPLTLAVLPHLNFSRKIALEAKEAGMEVILHLPLEPASNAASPEKGTIYRIMLDEEIKIRVMEALESVPAAAGISNHMGSVATRDERVMRVIMDEAKERNLYFLDSRTTAYSVCGKVAEKSGVRFISRDVFLDVDLPQDGRRDSEKIYERMRELVAVAKTRGRAVGIGHARKATLEVLKDKMPELEKEGIRFVLLSEIVYNK